MILAITYAICGLMMAGYALWIMRGDTYRHGALDIASGVLFVAVFWPLFFGYMAVSRFENRE